MTVVEDGVRVEVRVVVGELSLLLEGASFGVGEGVFDEPFSVEEEGVVGGHNPFQSCLHLSGCYGCRV